LLKDPTVIDRVEDDLEDPQDVDAIAPPHQQQHGTRATFPGDDDLDDPQAAQPDKAWTDLGLAGYHS
jgi:hypothetical protein